MTSPKRDRDQRLTGGERGSSTPVHLTHNNPPRHRPARQLGSTIGILKRKARVSLAFPGSPGADTHANAAVKTEIPPDDSPTHPGSEPASRGAGTRSLVHSHVEDVALVAQVALGQRG